MISLKNIVEGNEYFFFFHNYFCSGFVQKIDDYLLHITNGCFVYPKEEFAYKEATIDVNHLIGFASV